MTVLVAADRVQPGTAVAAPALDGIRDGTRKLLGLPASSQPLDRTPDHVPEVRTL